VKAFVIDGYGGPDRMRLGELPEPAPKKGEVVVAVVASSVNPVDWKIRAGQLRFLSGSKFPRALGTELSGVVDALGPGVTQWAVGDAVYGMTVTALGRPGAHAERVAVPATALRRKPDGIDHELAAVLPVAALTALSGLRMCGEVAGRSVAVVGATGGVGHFALQIAKARGAQVTAVCRAANADKARSLGADTVVDYRARDFTRENERFDVVFDAWGGLGFGKAARALTARGIYVTPLGMPWTVVRSLVQNALGRKRLYIGNVRTQPEDYAEIERLVLSGAVRPRIDRVVPLARAGEAFAASERGGVAGKIVVRVGA